MEYFMNSVLIPNLAGPLFGIVAVWLLWRGIGFGRMLIRWLLTPPAPVTLPIGWEWELGVTWDSAGRPMRRVAAYRTGKGHARDSYRIRGSARRLVRLERRAMLNVVRQVQTLF